MSGVVMKEYIEIRNASINNLKNISVTFPIGEFSCVTGVSGCGKSSLVYDTIYAESQRNFLESMSGNMYGQKLMDKPPVDSITNLRPALNVSQNYFNSNPRSTVGTITDISYYLRTLFALISNYEKGTKLTEASFSPNNPSACCPFCRGLGEEYVISEEYLVPDKSKTLAKGAILYYKGKENSVEYKTLEAICNHYGIDINKKFFDLTDREVNILLHKNEEDIFLLKFRTPKGRYKQKEIRSKGALAELKEKSGNLNQPSVFSELSKYLVKQACSHCHGSKLKSSVLLFKVNGKNIADVEGMKINELLVWTRLTKQQYLETDLSKQVKQLCEQVNYKLQKLIDLKISYLSLNRSIPSLSGGEIQRIRIGIQLTCSLKGLLYILDEPCKGLHARDIDAVISATKQLVNENNTVIAIEHNKQYVSSADKVIELGPEGGPKGGFIISEGKPKKDFQYTIDFKPERKFKKYIGFHGISYHNLVKQFVEIPIESITCITGVSGSGKSSLVHVIAECLSSKQNYCCEKVISSNAIKHIEFVDQKPIGKTPRSTVISYLGIYDEIREIFARTKEAIEHGFMASDFSVNVKGGRCEECQGTGYKKIELTYLPDTYILCSTCGGHRFHDDVLTVRFKNHTINDVLNSTILDLVDIFMEYPNIHSKLQCMIDIGLEYLKLGQMSMNLSGGEAQRIKLAKALGNGVNKNNLFILDEPTSGLNNKDVGKLESILKGLRNKGNTILIIEHNPEFILNNAEYLVDFGCFGGNQGGKVVSQGSVKEVFYNKDSSWHYLVKK